MPIHPQLPYPYFFDLITGQIDANALLRNLQYLAARLTIIQTGQLVPSGTLLLMNAGSTCPDGYTKLTASTMAGRYLRLTTSTAGTTGGTLSVSITDAGHTHGVGSYAAANESAHTHGVDPPSTTSGTPSSTTTVSAGTTATVSSSTHTHATNVAPFTSDAGSAHGHAVTGTSASATTGVTGTINPKFLDIIICSKI